MISVDVAELTIRHVLIVFLAQRGGFALECQILRDRTGMGRRIGELELALVQKKWKQVFLELDAAEVCEQRVPCAVGANRKLTTGKLRPEQQT